VSKARRVGTGASSASSARVPPTAAVASAEQVEEGAREAPIEGAVRPGTVATPQMEAAASMADVPWRGVVATS
jgi:hypothetical protein